MPRSSNKWLIYRADINNPKNASAAMAVSPISSTRVSDLLLRQRLMSQTQRDQLDLFRLQNQISTGRRIFSPSDDAHAALRAMGLQHLLERKDQIAVNLQTNQAYLSATDTALGNVSNMIADVRGTVVSIIGTTATQQQRDAAVLEIDQAISSLLDVANYNFRGRYLFAGTDSATRPYEQTAAGIRYLGNEGQFHSYSDIERLFSTNAPGSKVFGGLSSEVRGRGDLNPNVTPATRLAELHGGLGVSKGSVRISDGTNFVTVDLSKAETLGDVAKMLEANPPEGRRLLVTITDQGLNVELDAAGGGALTIREVGHGSTANELGILRNIGAGVGPIVGEDLNPAIKLSTTLENILGTRAQTRIPSIGANNDIIVTAKERGIDFNDVAITFVDGGPLAFGAETAVYDDSDPANKTLTITIAEQRSTASNVIAAINAQSPYNATLDSRDLNNSGAGRIQSTALDPLASGVTSGGSGADLDLAGIQITNEGKTYAIDFTGSATVQDILNRINNSGAQVVASINDRGDGIDIRSRSSGSDLTIGENGGTTATQLGLRTLDHTTPLATLNYGRGVHTAEGADFVITRNDGVELEIDISGAQTIADVIELINLHPDNQGADAVVAQMVELGNGLQLVDDNQQPPASLQIRRINESLAAVDLGFLQIGQDVSQPPQPAVAASAVVSMPGANNDIRLTALQPGTAANGYEISFVDSGLGPGSENVNFSVPSRTIVFEIDPATTTAADVVNLLNSHPVGSLVFNAALEATDDVLNDGSGLITDPAVTATVAGGEPEILSAVDTAPLEAEGIFNALFRLRNAVDSNDQVELERSVALLDESILQLNFSRAQLGAEQQALDTMTLRLEDEVVELKSNLSAEIEVDITEAISSFLAKQASYQASLQTTAQVYSLTLLDFI